MEELFRSPLFQGVSAADAASMLQCLGAQRRHYARGERILRMGETTESLGLVLAGRVRVESVDMWGGRTLLGDAGPGEVFAEAYACVPGETLMVDAVAAEDAEILFLNAARVLSLSLNSSRMDQSCNPNSFISDSLRSLFCGRIVRLLL